MLLIIVLTTSCTSDILDKKPLNIISDNDVWADPTLMDLYINGIYTELPWLYNEMTQLGTSASGNHGEYFGPQDIADEAMSIWYPTYYPFKSGGLSDGGGLFDWWGYNAIRLMNDFIERAPDSSYPNEIKDKRIAEVRFLRAFSYFALVKRYGGVPLITKVQSLKDPEDELYPTRDKEEDVYNFIISELDAIIDILPPAWTSADYGRPTKYAALALKSRAAMYAASIAQWGELNLDGVVGIPSTKAKYFWELSYNASKTIIVDQVHSLYKKHLPDNEKNYREIFTDKRNVEIIFAKQFTGAGGTSNNWGFFQMPKPNSWGGGNQSSPYYNMVEEYEWIDGTPGIVDPAKMGNLWTLDQLWGNKDPRFHASIYTHGTMWRGNPLEMYRGIIRAPGEYPPAEGSIQYTGSYRGVQAVGNSVMVNDRSFGIRKFLQDDGDYRWANTGGKDADWVIFRYGEILLNFAEAAFELNKEPEALDAVNEIRERAGIALLTSITRDKIRHERKVELAFEGNRYWDLRRWRTAVTELTRNFDGLRYILQHATVNLDPSDPLRQVFLFRVPNIHGTTTPPVFHKKNYYLPITPGRIANNPNLIENPGY